MSSIERKPRSKNIKHLWEFLLELLADESCKSLITWSREAYREFKFKKPEEVATRWGLFKHRPDMNYGKLSRALRYYYSTGIIKKVPGQRMVYKFHKLPYEYTLGRSLSDSQATAQLTERTTKPDGGNNFKSARPSLCGKDSVDKEKLNKFLHERLTRKQPVYTEQAEQKPLPAASPEVSTACDPKFDFASNPSWEQWKNQHFTALPCSQFRRVTSFPVSRLVV